MGVGYLRIVDRDIVERSNLQRQYLYDTTQLGLPKVEAALLKLEKLNPDVKLDPQPLSVDDSNAGRIVRDMDVVVDGLDRIEPRYSINRACARQGIPYVFGAAIETFGSVSTIIPGKTACLECFYSGIDESLLPTCSVVGVHPSVTSIISSLEVSEAIRIIIGSEPELAGRLLFFDLSTIEFDTIDLRVREDCDICGGMESEAEKPREGIEIEEVCSRGGRRIFIAIPERDLNLDLPKIQTSLQNSFDIASNKTRLSIIFSLIPDIRVSLLTTGISILEGDMNREDALEAYNKLTDILDRLGIPER